MIVFLIIMECLKWRIFWNSINLKKIWSNAPSLHWIFINRRWECPKSHRTEQRKMICPENQHPKNSLMWPWTKSVKRRPVKQIERQKRSFIICWGLRPTRHGFTERDLSSIPMKEIPSLMPREFSTNNKSSSAFGISVWPLSRKMQRRWSRSIERKVVENLWETLLTIVCLE